MNLVEILKNCPQGTKLYSLIHGVVEFSHINDSSHPINVTTFSSYYGEYIESFTVEGKYYDDFNGECVLFPSKKNRDWNNFVPLKKDLPKGTVVLVKDLITDNWQVRVYADKGRAYDGGTINGYKVFWQYIVKCPEIILESYCIEITEENNYGTLYWNKHENN